MEKATITRKEAAKRLGVATATIDKLIRNGEIPSFRPSPRRVVIPREPFDRWINEHTKSE